ncbi:ATP-binding protein [Streptomyces sp. NPDC059785]|uniref:ATP-binding protein n=1 Tax=Streptomyces sp. NPDC059785 TaxID=3346945 RepID=UPI003657C397
MTVPRAHPRRPSPAPPPGAHAPDGHAPGDRERTGELAVIHGSEPRRVRSAVPAHPSQAAGVRRMVAGCLAGLRLPCELLDNAVLATDEIFSNAVKYGSADPGDTITVTVESTACELRVTVTDGSCEMPRTRDADEAAECGRGLAIVDALADDWGVVPPEPGEPGKRVWFTLGLLGAG